MTSSSGTPPPRLIAPSPPSFFPDPRPLTPDARFCSHRFGQIIGDVLEAGIRPLSADFARRHGLYLDAKGSRPCRRGKKCSWVGLNGNANDLDFVLERGGSDDKIGMPAAFIETAWRRYTKHSRNKAQEIQGAPKRPDTAL